MPKTAQFDGHADLYLKRDEVTEKKDQPVKFTATFDDNGAWTVKKDAFERVIVKDIEGPGSMTLKLTVTLKNDAAAPAIGADGTVELTARFKFQLKGTLINSDSTLPLVLDNAGPLELVPEVVVEGAAVDRTTGSITLAGIGTFSGDLLAHNRCAVLLRGRFDPNPWN